MTNTCDLTDVRSRRSRYAPGSIEDADIIEQDRKEIVSGVRSTRAACACLSEKYLCKARTGLSDVDETLLPGRHRYFLL